ncbi:MAG TPA: TolC family protein [Kofleriaceae bacterium]|nr:TolC family protein [Kofleriaceae bacterium]
MRTVVVLMLAAAHAAAAQSALGETPVMSLHQAIEFARTHQPSLAAARARAEVAREQAKLPRAALTPTLTAAAEALVGTANNTTASYATLGSFDVTRVGGTPANAPVSWSPEPSTLAGVSLHGEVFDFGRYEDQGDAFDALARAAGEDTNVEDLDLVLLVSDAFYAVQGAKAVLSASQAAATRSREHRDFAKAGVDAQLRAPIELTRAEADLARFEVDAVRAQGNLTVAQSVLAAAIGASAPTVDAGADDLVYSAPPPLDRSAKALDHDPALRAARDRLAAQQSLTRSIRDELRPDLSFSAELTGRAGGAAVAADPTPAGGGWLPDVPNWDALLVVTWPLFDRVVSVRANTSERVEAVRAAELAQVSEQVAAFLQTTYVELDVAQQALPALQRSVDAATANHAQADARFTAGLGNAVELADSEALLVDAQIQLAIGQFQLSRARARVQRALAAVSR